MGAHPENRRRRKQAATPATGRRALVRSIHGTVPILPPVESFTRLKET
jgi:hypothetical protein